jgi:folate-binding protein YgfZ
MELHDWHQSQGARFGEVQGLEQVRDYGDVSAELTALRECAVVLDGSHRSRVCLTGADRVRFLHGQVTNNINALGTGRGCYAALVTAKGKMESDLHIHCLEEELLLEFEPGLTSKVTSRLETYIVADDVEVVDIRPHVGLLSVQGPRAADVMQRLGLGVPLPSHGYESVSLSDAACGEWVLVNLPRVGTVGFDLFVANAALERFMDKLVVATREVGGTAGGWDAMEAARIEAGIPRFGQDMDETNIPLEAGLEERAVRYNKGCYIGQEVLNRIHSIGQVTRSLRGLLLPRDLAELPPRGEKLWHQGKEVGYITSSLESARFGRPLALGYVRKEVNTAETRLEIVTPNGNLPVTIVPLPFS